MHLRDFQIVLREHDKLTYLQLRECWDPIELEVRRASPPRCRFGDIGKIVLELGPEATPRANYRVLLNVGLYHFPEFNASSHLALPIDQRWVETIDIVESCMNHLGTKLGASIDWLTAPISHLRRVAPNNSFKPNPLRGSA